MNRFQYKTTEKNYGRLKTFLSSLAFLLILLCLLLGFRALSGGNLSRGRENLEKAIERTLTRCYAVEGSYPESLQYMEENYGLTYDSSRYYVDYRIAGRNVRPIVTVIVKGGE